MSTAVLLPFPSRSKPLSLKATVRAFERFGDEHHQTWPEDPRPKGDRALFSLKLMVWTDTCADIEGFSTAYAAWKSTCSPIPELHGRPVSSAEAPAGKDR